jgi:hypothetical protein
MMAITSRIASIEYDRNLGERGGMTRNAQLLIRVGAQLTLA